MKISLFVALAIAGTLGTVTPAASHDACGDQVIDLAGQAYWVIENADPTAHWGYLESNGVAELQRGGVMVHGGRDWCQASSSPDLGFY